MSPINLCNQSYCRLAVKADLLHRMYKSMMCAILTRQATQVLLCAGSGGAVLRRWAARAG